MSNCLKFISIASLLIAKSCTLYFFLLLKGFGYHIGSLASSSQLD
jgi:hypothetical protein